MKRRWVWQSLTQDGSQTRKVKARKSLPAGKTGEQGSLPRAERTIERAYVVWKQIKERERARVSFTTSFSPTEPRYRRWFPVSTPSSKTKAWTGKLLWTEFPTARLCLHLEMTLDGHTEPPVRLTQRRRGFVFFCHTASEPLSWWVCFIIVQLLSSGMRY